MRAIDIIGLVTLTAIVLFICGPKFASLCESLAEPLMESFASLVNDSVDEWKKLLKRLFNKK